MPTAEELLFAPMLKLERARHHINDLDGQITAFLNERPMRLVRRQDPKLGERSIRIKTEKPIPETTPALIGDAVHNIRSALDLALYAVASPRAKEPDEIQFPFAKRPEGLGRAIKKRQVEFAGTNVVKLVEKLKPYPGGNDLLCGLHDLDIRDKHKLIIAVARFPSFTFAQLHAIDPTMGSGPINSRDRVNFIVHDDLVYRWPIAGNRATRRAAKFFEEEANIQPRLAVSFGDGQPFHGDLITAKLRELFDYARGIVKDIVREHLAPSNQFPP